MNLQGTDTQLYTIPVPSGVNQVTLSATMLTKNRPLLEKINPYEPIVYLDLYDQQGNIVSYANSFGYESGKTYLETLTCDAPGNYTLVVKVYHGLKGGFFSLRGFSFVDNDVDVITNISQLEKPHYSLVPNLSLLAPYLTSAHGGIMLA